MNRHHFVRLSRQLLDFLYNILWYIVFQILTQIWFDARTMNVLSALGSTPNVSTSSVSQMHPTTGIALLDVKKLLLVISLRSRTTLDRTTFAITVLRDVSHVVRTSRPVPPRCCSRGGWAGDDDNVARQYASLLEWSQLQVSDSWASFAVR